MNKLENLSRYIISLNNILSIKLIDRYTLENILSKNFENVAGLFLDLENTTAWLDDELVFAYSHLHNYTFVTGDPSKEGSKYMIFEITLKQDLENIKEGEYVNLSGEWVIYIGNNKLLMTSNRRKSYTKNIDIEFLRSSSYDMTPFNFLVYSYDKYLIENNSPKTESAGNRSAIVSIINDFLLFCELHGYDYVGSIILNNVTGQKIIIEK